MKKILSATLIAGLFSGAVFAQTTVSSANIVGYVKAEKLGNNGYSLVGINFLTANQTLSELLDNGLFTGNYSDVSLSDRISIWNSATQKFETYAYYYIDGTYTANEGWKLLSDFSYGGTVQNPTIPSGSGIWLLSAASTTTTNIVLSGNVDLSATVTKNIAEGLNILSNPYAVAVTIDGLEINATGSYTDSALADRISLWNSETQKFETYAYYYIDGNYPANEGWKLLSDFSYGGIVQNTTIEVGQAFWYRAQSNITWIATKPF
jgi:uncharacterized protein (TIGR02597 family)